MSYVLGFGGQKGGTGKTILATSTAVTAAKTGAKVIVYDLDHTQQSAVLWAQRRREEGNDDPSIEVITLTRSEIPSALNGEDISILDLPGFADEKTASIGRHCHLFILPTGTGYTDLDTTISVAHELVAHGISKERLYFALTKTPKDKNAEEARDYVHRAGFQTIKGFSRFANAIEVAQNKGLGLTEVKFDKLREEATVLIEDIAYQLTREREIAVKETQDLEFEKKSPEQSIEQGRGHKL